MLRSERTAFFLSPYLGTVEHYSQAASGRLRQAGSKESLAVTVGSSGPRWSQQPTKARNRAGCKSPPRESARQSVGPAAAGVARSTTVPARCFVLNWQRAQPTVIDQEALVKSIIPRNNNGHYSRGNDLMRMAGRPRKPLLRPSRSLPRRPSRALRSRRRRGPAAAG